MAKFFFIQLKDLSLKVHTTIQPVFVSRKIEQELNVKETKPPIVDQQCVVYGFQCDLCDASYVGYTHLHNRVKGHKQQSSAIAKHYKNVHGTMPQGLLERFKVLKKCKNKFDCLAYEMLFIRSLKPNLNVQADSIRATESIFIIFFKKILQSSHPLLLILRATTALNVAICMIFLIFSSIMES